MSIPSKLFIPTTVDDFVGPAKGRARLLQAEVAEARANDRAPIKLLINGPPGVGKSALVRFVSTLLGCHPTWSTIKKNGTELKFENLETIASQMLTVDMFSDYRLLWVEEDDAIPRTSQIRFLTMLDDLLRAKAVILTSNCKLNDFEERFQSGSRPTNSSRRKLTKLKASSPAGQPSPIKPASNWPSFAAATCARSCSTPPAPSKPSPLLRQLKAARAF
jgi:DNA polymerase III delta prime subunit